VVYVSGDHRALMDETGRSDQHILDPDHQSARLQDRDEVTGSFSLW